MENHFFYKKFGRIDKKAYICNVNQTVSLMLSKNVQEMIPKIQQYLASQPIEKAWLFGSCSRGEETPKSDVDLLVRYQDSDSMSLFDISGIMVNLKKIDYQAPCRFNRRGLSSSFCIKIRKPR